MGCPYERKTMNFFVIPLRNEPRYTFSETLENVLFNFEVYYNDFDEKWKCHISSDDGQVDIKGSVLTTGVNLLASHGVNNSFGPLFMFDFTGQNEDPTYESINDTHVLAYLPLSATL